MSPADATNVNFLGFSFTLLMGMLMIVVPRRHAIVPIAVITCFVTLGQVADIGGLHFTMMRVLVVCGWLRLMLRGEMGGVRWCSIDYVFICWVVSNCALYMLREPNGEAFVSRLGFFFNSVGIYFLFRFLVRDLDDISGWFKVLAIIAVPLALAMLLEKLTGRNIFSVFGGVSAFTIIRDGKLRAQASFRHPILAGTFGATLMPLFVSLWFQRGRSRSIGVMGILASAVIALSSASGGPVLSYVCGLFGLLMWRFRQRLRTIRWVGVFGIVSLHMIMKAPVWYLLARVGDLTGGSGWHRAYLIDMAIAHFNQWWFIGTSHTDDWMPYGIPGMPGADITNEYIAQGVNGGLLTMLLFIAIIVLCFKGLGRVLRLSDDRGFESRMLIWCLGSALFVHVVSFLGISYFDQSIVTWNLLLASIAAVVSLPKSEGDAALVRSGR